MNCFNICIIIAVTLVIIFTLLVIYQKFYLTPENFTDQSGYNCVSCGSKTLRDCLECSNCGWCMKKGDKGFDSQCVSAGAGGVPTNDVCDKFYANDAWTRAMVSTNNNNYNLSIPVFS